MIKDNLFTGSEAREKLMSGVRRAAEAVSVTLGTSGSNSLIECIENPNHFSTNDGATILGSIHFADPLEEMGRRVLYEAVSRANKASGDGSSTTTVLTAAILEEGMKHLGETSPMEIKRSLEACIPLIEESINAQKKEITVDSVGQVATISAEDESIGTMIQDIYKQIGKTGVINWDASKTPFDSYTIGSGITVHGGTYVSRYMCDLTESGFLTQARLENPKVLLVKKKVTSTTDFDSIFDTLFKQEIKEVVVFVEDIDPSVVNALIQARQKIGFSALVIKMPVLWADEWWEDLAAASGGTVIDSVSGIRMRNIGLEHLGTFEHITVDREDTYIDGIKDLSKHILALQVGGTDAELNRAARLNTKTARYFVGAHSESALAYRRLKVEDAINAASCALENGVVPGGGIALRNAAWKLWGLEGEILTAALQAPFVKIVENSDKTVKDLPEMSGSKGFNSKTGEVVDMFEAGIVDPTDVVLNAVRNAIGVAASILTCGTVVTLPRDDQPQQQSLLPR